MKKYLISIFIALFVPSLVLAITVPWNKVNPGQIYPPLFNDQVLINRTSSTTNSALEVNGTITSALYVATSTATSTFGGGINITSGCFATGGVCLSSGSSGITSIDTNNGLTGGPITTTGTIGLNTSNLATNALISWNGSNLFATGTPQLTVGNLLATSTASSTFTGPIQSPTGALVLGSKTLGIVLNPYYQGFSGTSGGVIIGTTTSYFNTGGQGLTVNRQATLSVIGPALGSSSGDLSGDAVAPIIFVQGNKGLNSTSGSFATGGNGQSIYLSTGSGGNATGGSFFNSGGNGGGVNITTGQGGTGASGNGSYGNITLGQSAGGYTFALNPVGIGSSFGPFTTPVSRLDVNGNVSIGTYAAANAAPTNGMIISGNVGIGTSSPYARLSVQSNASTGDAFVIATSSKNAVAGYDNDGHYFTAGPAPAISACGTGSGTVVGNDQSGTITTATAASACTLTFTKAYQSTPTCIVTDDSLAGFASISSISTSAVTFGVSAALTGGKLFYQCSYNR